MLSRRIAGLYPRLNPPAISTRDMPPVNAVLISHPHLDHMDIPTLDRLDKSAAVVVPRGTGNMAETLGYKETVAMRTWEEFSPANGIKVTATPAVHIGVRGWGLRAAARGAVGYVVEMSGLKIYFAGDTAYGPHFGEIREKLKPDIALLPIGAYRPWFFMKNFHMDPASALKAFEDLGAKWCLPYHWGTFVLSLEPVNEPLRLFRREAMRRDVWEKIVVLERGQTADFASQGFHYVLRKCLWSAAL